MGKGNGVRFVKGIRIEEFVNGRGVVREKMMIPGGGHWVLDWDADDEDVLAVMARNVAAKEERFDGPWA